MSLTSSYKSNCFGSQGDLIAVSFMSECIEAGFHTDIFLRGTKPTMAVSAPLLLRSKTFHW